MMAGWQEAPKYGFDFEIHIDSPDGKLLGKGSLMPPGKQKSAMINIQLQPVVDQQYHTIYIVSKAKDERENVRAGIGFIRFNAK
jgi:hypothetical protein